MLFTYQVTQAIHLELARNLSGGEFLLCLEQFVNIRRVPKFMLSDNGTNFTFVQPLVGQKVKITDPRIDNFLSSIGLNGISYQPFHPGMEDPMNV